MAPTSALDNMKNLTEATIEGFNKWDYAALRATRSDDFVYQFLPLNLGTPPRNNAEYHDFFHNQLTPLFQKFELTPITTFYDDKAMKSVIYGSVFVQSIVGSYEMELVMMLTFDEGAKKIRRIDEFFDSATYSAFFAKVQELQNQATAE